MAQIGVTPLALPLGELSAKLTERAVKSLILFGSSGERNCPFALSAGKAGTSPRGRGKAAAKPSITTESLPCFFEAFNP